MIEHHHRHRRGFFAYFVRYSMARLLFEALRGMFR
jgi:hypothetical protein